MKKTIGLFLIAILMAGCGNTKVVYLGDNTTKMVQLRETKKNVKVWVKDEQGSILPATTDLLEGGFYRKDLK